MKHLPIAVFALFSTVVACSSDLDAPLGDELDAECNGERYRAICSWTAAPASYGVGQGCKAPYLIVDGEVVLRAGGTAGCMPWRGDALCCP